MVNLLSCNPAILSRREVCYGLVVHTEFRVWLVGTPTSSTGPYATNIIHGQVPPQNGGPVPRTSFYISANHDE